MDTHTAPTSQRGALRDIDHLNALLRAEISAVEAYDVALRRVRFSPAFASELSTCLQSHRDREAELRERIVSLGGAPASESGAWGSLAKWIEGGAAALGVGPALYALSEGEAHGYRVYQRHMKALDPSQYGFLRTSLFPRQQATTQIVERLHVVAG